MKNNDNLKEHIAKYMENRKQKKEEMKEDEWDIELNDEETIEDKVKVIEEILMEVNESIKECKCDECSENCCGCDEVKEFENLLDKLKEDEEETTEEIEQRVKEAAENITLLDDAICIPVVVIDNGEKELVDKFNCNIIPVPILDMAIVSNIGLEIIDVSIEYNMESILDLELTVVIPTNDSKCLYKFTLGELYKAGLLIVVGSLKDELELTPIEYRGLTSRVDLSEINSLL